MRSAMFLEECDKVVSSAYILTWQLCRELEQYMMKLVLDSGEKLPDAFILPDAEWTDVNFKSSGDHMERCYYLLY